MLCFAYVFMLRLDLKLSVEFWQCCFDFDLVRDKMAAASHDEFQLVPMQDPSEWIMPQVDVPDNAASDLVTVLQNLLAAQEQVVHPSHFCLIPRALYFHAGHMFLVQVDTTPPVDEVKYSYQYESSQRPGYKATLSLLLKPVAGGGVERLVQFHSYRSISDVHGRWWICPNGATMRICFNYSVDRVHVLHPTEVDRLPDGKWVGRDDKGANITMEHVRSIARIGADWWPTLAT